MVTEKKCTKCEKVKPLEEFAKNRNRKDGHEYYCRSCVAEYAREWRRKHPDYGIAKTRIVIKEKWCPRCKKVKPIEEFPEKKNRRDGRGVYCRLCRNEYKAQWRREQPEQHKKIRHRHQLMSKYGITLDEYNKMLQSQNDVCAVCSKPCPTGNHLAVDHDHKSGEVRGLLCVNCNAALGYMQDDPSLLWRLADYLEEHE